MDKVYEDRIDFWAERLESGDFRQGSGRLKQKIDGDVNYCCLGVGSELCPGIDWGNCPLLDGEFYCLMDDDGSYVSLLNKKVINYYNLSTGDGSFEWNSLSDSLRDELSCDYGLQGMSLHDYCSLAMLNDCAVSFKDIARIIRERPHGLFKD